MKTTVYIVLGVAAYAISLTLAYNAVRYAVVWRYGREQARSIQAMRSRGLL